MKNTMLRISGLILLIMSLYNCGIAQQFAGAIAELQKIKNAYTDTGYNSFSIKYQYAREVTPGKILDTLSFQYKIKGNNYYCKVDQIEFIRNDHVQLTIYHNEKTIVLSNPLARDDIDKIFMSNWDSAFVATYIDSITVSDNKNNRTIHFHFTPAAKYSSCSVIYNSNTSQPNKISYVERATQSIEEGQTQPNGIIITMLFSIVNKAGFNESVFDEEKYVKMQENQWELSSDTKSYRLINNTYQTD